MSFAKLQTRLREDGWFVEWNMPCCQSCAWGDVPDVHQVGPLCLMFIKLDHSKGRMLT